MNNDRKLLEQAAKAAGIGPRRLPHAWPNRFDDDQWNPLTDDGDALRLAVKFSLDIIKFNKSVGVKIDPMSEYIFEDYGDDPYAATRRAIVRAAAEIGRTM